jgi:ATP phosphoribosyltransferase
MNRIRIAVPKGRLQSPAFELFAAAGYPVPADADLSSRRLRFDAPPIEWILVKDADVPVYVENGAAAAGVAGLDQILEQEADVYQPVEMGFGRCALWLISAPGTRPMASGARVATKFPRLTRAFAAQRGMAVEIVTLAGSIELAAVLGLTTYIADLVATGETLRANGLEPMERIAEIAPRLIVNKAAWRLDDGRIRDLSKRVAAAAEVIA